MDSKKWRRGYYFKFKEGGFGTFVNYMELKDSLFSNSRDCCVYLHGVDYLISTTSARLISINEDEYSRLVALANIRSD